MCIRDSGNTTVYSTTYFGGSDSKTAYTGSLASDILVIYRVYDGSSTGIDNETSVKVRIGDWFKLSQDTIEEYTVFDFNVPHFRITNTDTSTKYAYVQTAIDNATAGDTIVLEAGIYRESIVIDKGLNLRGSTLDDGNIEWDGVHTSTATIFTVDNSDGLGVPPVANSSRAGITVAANDVSINSLIIANFTHGISIEDSNDIDIIGAITIRTQVSGISIASSDSVNISGFTIYGRDTTGTGILIEDTASSVHLFSLEFAGSSVNSCDTGISVAGDDVSIDGVEIIHGTNDGIHITATASDVILANNVIHSNGGNGIDVSGLTSGTNKFYGNITVSYTHLTLPTNREV